DEHLQLEANGIEIDLAPVRVRYGQKSVPASQADVVAAALEHGDLQRRGQQLVDEGQVAVGQLLLQVDRVRGDHRAALGARRPEQQRGQVAQRFADARA